MRKPIIGIIGKVQPQYEEDIWHRIDELLTCFLTNKQNV